ncbi:MAG: phage tail protein [Pseudonocardiaceae bacterium]
MSRGTVDGLASAHPLGELLPGVYLEDSLAQRFTEGLDTVLAPVFVTLDCLDAYLDPWLTPGDFLPWLASWVGIELDETWPESRQRAIVAAAARLHCDQGTHRGLVEYLQLLTGGEVELIESGGTRWSAEPGTSPPGETTPLLQVIVRVSDPNSVNRARLDHAVRDASPAHLPHQIQVLPLRSASRG